MARRTVFSVIIFITILSCSNLNTVKVDKKQNILTYEDKYGIISYIKFDTDKYSLNDTVRICLLTINNSDSHKVHIHSNNGPLWQFDIYNKNMELVESLPRFITPTIYDFNFSPGDTFKSTLKWTQNQYANNPFQDLKVFSGEYYVTGNQPGLPAGKVGIWIRISEDGDPLSTKLYWHFSNRDSIKIDFLIRNRISKKLIFKMDNKSSAKIQFYNGIDNRLIREMDLDVNLSKIELAPKSDFKIFSFKESKAFLKSIGLSGSFNCKIIIPCKERNIMAKGSIVIN